MDANEPVTRLTSIEEQLAGEQTEEMRDMLMLQLSQSEAALIEYLYTLNSPLERGRTSELLLAVAAAQQTVQAVTAKLIKLKRLRKMQR